MSDIIHGIDNNAAGLSPQ